MNTTNKNIKPVWDIKDDYERGRKDEKDVIAGKLEKLKAGGELELDELIFNRAIDLAIKEIWK